MFCLVLTDFVLYEVPGVELPAFVAKSRSRTLDIDRNEVVASVIYISPASQEYRHPVHVATCRVENRDFLLAQLLFDEAHNFLQPNSHIFRIS